MHSIKKQSAATSRDPLFCIMHIVHEGVPSSSIWFHRVRQRLLPFLPLYFSTVLTELVTWDSGHHPLFLAYHICSEAFKKWKKELRCCRGKSYSHTVWDGRRQGLSEQRIISAYIVQSHKIRCVNPWQRLSFSSFKTGFVWSFGCSQRGGWMKPVVIRKALQKKLFF